MLPSLMTVTPPLDFDLQLLLLSFMAVAARPYILIDI
jgi:hypothetical protein